MKNLKFIPELTADAVKDYVKASVKEYKVIESALSMKSGMMVLGCDGSGRTVLGIVTKKDAEGFGYKESRYEDEVEVKFAEGVFYEVLNDFKSNFIGTDKEKLVKWIPRLNHTVNSTVRIGGLFCTADEKESEVMKKAKADITEMFAKDNVKVRFNWSDKCGQVMKIDGPGYNVLLVNEKNEEFTELFEDKVYHHNHRKMIEWRIVENELIKTDGDEKMMEMIHEYTVLMQPATIVEEPVAEEKKESIPAVEELVEEVKVEANAPKANGRNRNKKK